MARRQKIGLFLGTYTHEITEGSRVSLPSRFRTELSENQIVLIQAPEGCLLGFDGKDFIKNTQKVMEQSLFEPNARNPRRELFNNAVTVEVDRLGRFVIPENLRKWAEIGQKVVIGGLGDAFEIWSLEKYRQYPAQKLGQ